jgi:hypothetical protein
MPTTFELHPAAVAELAEHYDQPEAVILAAVEEFKGYWVIGAGAGKRRRNWQAKCREDIRRKAETGRLAEIAAKSGAARDDDGSRVALLDWARTGGAGETARRAALDGDESDKFVKWLRTRSAKLASANATPAPVQGTKGSVPARDVSALVAATAGGMMGPPSARDH